MSSNDDIRTITHTASGAACKIHAFGATVLSYTTGNREVIFVSKLAKLDGSKPVRGGVPLVFPIFGPPKSGTMPQHGFARRNRWTFLDSYDTKESAGARYELKFCDVKDGLGDSNDWANEKYDCTLVCTLDCNASQVTTSLEIQNTGSAAFPFQALLHTYYSVAGKAALQPGKCFVSGLAGYTVADKVTKAAETVSDAEAITITGEVDRVYDPPNGTTSANVRIHAGEGASVELTATGTLDDVALPISCVVWNPFIEKAKGLSDFGDEEYFEMICVEPGILKDSVVLDPGKTARLTQHIKV